MNTNAHSRPGNGFCFPAEIFGRGSGLFVMVLAAVFVASVFIPRYFFAYEKPVPRDRLYPEEIMLLQEGDFILRRGVGMTSDLIAGALNESRQITHGGILVRDGSERWMVIHALSAVVSDFDGVQVQRLEEFAEAGMEGSLTVVRSRHAGFAPGGGGIASFGAELAERARFYLEKRVPFDFDFDSASSNAFYCSEFLVRTYQDVFGKDIFSYTPQGIPRFSSFFQPEYFELVLDHGNPLQEDSR